MLVVIIVVLCAPLVLAGPDARWSECAAEIAESHSSVSVSSVKSSARSATVNTEASECFMAVAP